MFRFIQSAKLMMLLMSATILLGTTWALCYQSNEWTAQMSGVPATLLCAPKYFSAPQTRLSCSFSQELAIKIPFRATEELAKTTQSGLVNVCFPAFVAASAASSQLHINILKLLVVIIVVVVDVAAVPQLLLNS